MVTDSLLSTWKIHFCSRQRWNGPGCDCSQLLLPHSPCWSSTTIIHFIYGGSEEPIWGFTGWWQSFWSVSSYKINFKISYHRIIAHAPLFLSDVPGNKTYLLGRAGSSSSLPKFSFSDPLATLVFAEQWTPYISTGKINSVKTGVVDFSPLR